MKKKYKKGDIILTKVTGVEKYGIFVKVDDDYNGLIHISEISYKYVADVNKYAGIGDLIKVEVIDLQEDEKKLILSIKNINKRNNLPKEHGKGFLLLKRNLTEWIDKYSK